jgi:Dockerin type I domain
VTGDRVVNSNDQKYINSRSGQKANSANFRGDVTVDGIIDGKDASFVGNRIGHKLP